ncbi:hypothetical protein L596_023722 [Steinernema carpocapsae]|uniref:EGF-like domain-containing protein n=1 Tax=Steinernema carpocapsae TaxID=34508 RepID=A0A4U5MF97_STECR|nr:hypothetical protein L596_023722 [Steinernema carpocapsae]
MNTLLNSFNFQFLNGDNPVQCKAITNPLIGLVADGTSCGSGRVCVQGACLPLVQVSPPVHCPSNNLALQCSGHGDCTTTQKCLCYDGWAGVACDIKSNTTRRIHAVPATTPGVSIPSLSIGRTLETTTLLGILLFVGVSLLALLICLLFCYNYKFRMSSHVSKAQEHHGQNDYPQRRRELPRTLESGDQVRQHAQLPRGETQTEEQTRLRRPPEDKRSHRRKGFGFAQISGVRGHSQLRWRSWSDDSLQRLRGSSHDDRANDR